MVRNLNRGYTMSSRFRQRRRRSTTASGPTDGIGGFLVWLASVLASYMLVDAILQKLGVAEDVRLF